MLTSLRVLRVTLVLLLIGASPSLLRADDGLAEGLEAYDGGDYDSAYQAWAPLAEAGNVEAQVALADLYSNGFGVEVDLAQAAHWYRRAAEQGDATAQLNLGDFYAKGSGVARDLVLAYVWLARAAAQGRIWAEKRRETVATSMTAEQIAAAKALLSNHSD